MAQVENQKNRKTNMTKAEFLTIKRTLRKHIDGRLNAKPLQFIVDRLCGQGINTSRRHFQLVLKPKLLVLGLAVAPSKDGMFICRWRRDYVAARKWYAQRIFAEMKTNNGIVALGRKRCSKSLI
jgi:hypothetical protein